MKLPIMVTKELKKPLIKKLHKPLIKCKIKYYKIKLY